jgi:hypothetical protein
MLSEKIPDKDTYRLLSCADFETLAAYSLTSPRFYRGRGHMAIETVSPLETKKPSNPTLDAKSWINDLTSSIREQISHHFITFFYNPFSAMPLESQTLSDYTSSEDEPYSPFLWGLHQ